MPPPMLPLPLPFYLCPLPRCLSKTIATSSVPQDCETVLAVGAQRDRRGVHVPSSFQGAPEQTDNRFLVYTLSAGALYGIFEDARCSSRSIKDSKGRPGHRCYLGGWSYTKGSGSAK
eukprot:1551156-Pyramimonas_sp.AAC.1